MNNATYRGVIIGLTGIGARRPPESPQMPIYGAMPRSHAAAYYRHPQTDLTAVCDIRQEALDTFRTDWQDVWPDMHYYTDYREMLAQEQPDIVSVATPDHLHADFTVAAAESGAKAILCEKPIATTLADADRMIEACQRHNVLLSIEHTRRWSPTFLAVRELIRSGQVGQLRSIVSSLYSQRAMLFRNGTHSIDMLTFFAESNPAWVWAELEAGFEHFTEYTGDGGHDPATDPAASAYIHFENGVRAFFNCIKIDMPGSQFELICDGGRIEVSDRGATLLRGTSHYEWARSEIPVDDYMYTYQIGALAELVHTLENGGELVSTGQEARKTLEIMLAILRSHHQGNVRVNLPL
ncbi:MAG: Gfo/Idh/MocA family oxidoreductase [Caldilineaceae bacterium]|nr:Gfo/Idh/MocA family oxidoreductase [Caldilineaceae bacterium]